MPDFKTDDGRLTPYAFGCGYRERKTTDPDALREKDLFTEFYHEHGHYHVRQTDRRDGGLTRVFWVTYNDDEFALARAKFDEQPGVIVA